MGAPKKRGVDYWPFDIGLLEDKKFKLIKGEFGIKGAFIALLLLNEVYRTDGYYKAWDDDDCLLMSEGVGCGCTPTLVSEVLHRCCERSLFDKRVFDAFGVITSAGIQRRYLRIVANNRDSVPIIQEYWLLDVNDENDVPASTLNKLTFISKDRKENPVIRKENPVIRKENPVIRKDNATNQSKANQSKVNQIKSPPACAGDEVASLPDEIDPIVLQSIEGRILGRKSSGREQGRIADLQSEYGGARLLEAIKRTVAAGGRSVEYLARVLESAGDSLGSAAMCRNGCDYDEIEEMLDDEFYE